MNQKSVSSSHPNALSLFCRYQFLRRHSVPAPEPLDAVERGNVEQYTTGNKSACCVMNR
jgi:hypothetical protein